MTSGHKECRLYKFHLPVMGALKFSIRIEPLLLKIKTIPENAKRNIETTCNAKMNAATLALSRTPKMVSKANAPKIVMVAGIL